MERTIVNSFGLVFTIQGSETALKPVMLTGHQDVIPVDDPNDWTYPPFDPFFNGTWLWGRGASDDKNSLTAIFSVLETLFSRLSWTPRRTLIIALGFDEESFGTLGAGNIGQYLEQIYGRDSMVMLLDEGGMGLDLVENTTLCESNLRGVSLLRTFG